MPHSYLYLVGTQGVVASPPPFAHVQSKDSRLAASFLHISWAVGKMPTLLEGDTRQQAGLATQWRASALKEWWRPA